MTTALYMVTNSETYYRSQYASFADLRFQTVWKFLTEYFRAGAGGNLSLQADNEEGL